MNDAITFTMRLDASDLKKLFGSSMGGARGGAGRAATMLAAGGGGMGGGEDDQSEQRKGKNQAQGMATNVKFMSIFKPLAALSLMEKALGGILRNSQIANTYGAAFGKMIGAAMDLLLVPFLPVFNLILAGLSKLIAWLVTSGALEELSKIVQRASGYLEAIAHWIVQVWQAIKSLNFEKLGGLLLSGIAKAVKTAVSDPKGALMTAALPVIGLAVMSKLPIIGPLMRMATAPMRAVGGMAMRGAGAGLRGLFGGGGAAGAAGGGEAAGGIAGGLGAEGAAGAAGGMGLAGMLGIGALAAGGGLAVGAGANYLAGKAGIHGTARNMLTGAAGGAAAGAVVGSVVPVLGTAVGALGGGLIGAGLGYMKGQMSGQGTQQAGGNSVTNSNNVINFTQNNTFGSNVNQKQVASDAISEIERRTGYKLSVRGGH